ncbi:hypothetical protein [Liquorilactobacillus uvarum]|uniref:hypothetical protein n=1 Tax=Liquorilactobacillus uvarum TaxID=303240 RepID=UPI0012EE5673|nr:hypothetical protein [Liquorilactobacillus uvarum]
MVSSQSSDEIPSAGKKGILKLSKAHRTLGIEAWQPSFSDHFLCYDTYFSSK